MSLSRGGVVGNGKRKAELPTDDNERASKARRTEPSDAELSASDSDDENDEEEEGNDDGDDGDDDEGEEEEELEEELEEGDDDNDIPAHPSYVNKSFSADEEPHSERTTPATPAVGSTLHPSLSRTALELYRQMYPHSKKNPLYNRLSAKLGHRLIKRVPLVSDRFNDTKPQNITSFLMQAVGDELPKPQRCEKCTRGSGVYSACVVVRDQDFLAATGGACANCWYHRQGSLCTLRKGAPSTGTGPAKQTPVPVPKPPLQTPQPATILRTPTPVPTPPLHPSYAAALAAGTVAAAKSTPGLALNATATAAAQTQGRGLSMDDRVRVWEKRYGGMSTDKLMAAQEHLNEWQEDLTTRMMAMNRVVLERLREREGLV